jgi:hypothetical protein
LLPVAAVCLATVGLLAAGCGNGSRVHGVAAKKHAVAHRCAAGAERTLARTHSGVAAFVTRPTTAYRRPGHAPIRRFALLNVNGVSTVFSVLAERVDVTCRPTWLHVQLPIRPNGATGWVRAADVSTEHVHTRILVDLSERRVRLYRNGDLVLSSSVAIGSPATPTPLGRYYVNQRLVPTDPTGPYGPRAIGISAFSPVLTGWAQGGPIAIHGTNQRWSIGHDVSNGCIRVPNDVIRRLFAATPPGTPVVIRR